MEIDTIDEIKEEHDFTSYFYRHIQRAAIINYRLNLLINNFQIDKIVFPKQLANNIMGDEKIKKTRKDALDADLEISFDGESSKVFYQFESEKLFKTFIENKK